MTPPEPSTNKILFKCGGIIVLLLSAVVALPITAMQLGPFWGILFLAFVVGGGVLLVLGEDEG